MDQTFGFILSVALNNFALSSLFKTLREADSTDFTEYKALLGTIVQPKLYALLIALLPPDDTFLPIAVFGLTEVLLGLNHRNKVLLGSINLFEPLFHRFSELNTKDKPRSVLHKLLKRISENGIPVSDVRGLFRGAVRDGKDLNAEVLDVIRSGMKSRWTSHFSLEGSAAFLVKNENAKGLPATGFTFMVRRSLILPSLV